MTNGVPKIGLRGGSGEENAQVFSDAALPITVADTCACWDHKEKLQASRWMRTKDKIECLDATAFIAMTALGYDMAIKCKTIKAQLVKLY